MLCLLCLETSGIDYHLVTLILMSYLYTKGHLRWQAYVLVGIPYSIPIYQSIVTNNEYFPCNEVLLRFFGEIRER
jgi:hypothetical protein